MQPLNFACIVYENTFVANAKLDKIALPVKRSKLPGILILVKCHPEKERPAYMFGVAL